MRSRDGSFGRARKFATAVQKYHGTYFGSQALQDNWNQLMREEDSDPTDFPTNTYRSIVTSLLITGSPQPDTVLFYIRDRSKNRKAFGSWRIVCPDGYYWVME